MILTFLLMVLGILFLLIEVFLPGFGVFGVLGTIITLIAFLKMIFLASVINFKLGVLIILIGIFLAYITLKLLIKKIKASKNYNNLILFEENNISQEKVQNLEELIGKRGITKTSLRPFGQCDFNGILLEVISEDGYILENTLVKVSRIFDNKIYVKTLNNN